MYSKIIQIKYQPKQKTVFFISAKPSLIFTKLSGNLHKGIPRGFKQKTNETNRQTNNQTNKQTNKQKGLDQQYLSAK